MDCQPIGDFAEFEDTSETDSDETQPLELGYDFNIFEYIDSSHSRESAFVTLTQRHTELWSRRNKLNNYELFLTRIFRGYAQYEVSYHNDIHALDVMQMSSTLMCAGMASVA
jgi:hypothetical protein